MESLRATVEAIQEHQREDRALGEEARQSTEQLERQVSRVGKELFRTNTQAEAQIAQAKVMLDQAREAEKYRDRHLEQSRRDLETARSDGKMEALLALLPVLDSLGEALAGGARCLPLRESDERVRPPSMRARLEGAWKALRGKDFQGGSGPGPEILGAWMHGLALIQARILDTLADARIHPMETAGQVFDPHLHVAVDVVPSEGVPTGTLLREVRRGYFAGDKVLRCAEVVVARSSSPQPLERS
jgi:molecular chaperone GrpE